jgi:hypothetical protein
MQLAPESAMGHPAWHALPCGKALRLNKGLRGNKRTDWGEVLASLCHGARRRTSHDLQCYTGPSRGWPPDRRPGAPGPAMTRGGRAAGLKRLFPRRPFSLTESHYLA